MRGVQRSSWLRPLLLVIKTILIIVSSRSYKAGVFSYKKCSHILLRGNYRRLWKVYPPCPPKGPHYRNCSCNYLGFRLSLGRVTCAAVCCSHSRNSAHPR